MRGMCAVLIQGTNSSVTQNSLAQPCADSHFMAANEIYECRHHSLRSLSAYPTLKGVQPAQGHLQIYAAIGVPISTSIAPTCAAAISASAKFKNSTSMGCSAVTA